LGNFLHRLGNFAFTHKWRVLFSWILLLVVLGVLAGMFIKPTSSAVTIPGTQAQKAIDTVSHLFPTSGKGSSRIVLAAPSGKRISDYQTQITTLVAGVQKLSGVTDVTSPFVNTQQIASDGTIAYIQVQLSDEAGSISTSTISSVATLMTQARANGLTVEVGGDLVNKVPGEILGIGEVAGVVIALFVLLITLGTLISAGMPIATALIAIGVSMAGLFSLSQVINISSTTPVLAVMLGLAVGIDYSLFIINKYRSYLLEGYQYKQAAARAIATAGNAVLFAAATVVIALSALTVIQIPFMTTMGLAGAGTVAVAAVVAVTLIPALLGIAGDKIFRGKTKRLIKEAQTLGVQDVHTTSHITVWYKWGAFITRRPLLVLIAGIIVMVAIALPARELVLGLPIDQFAAKSSTQRKAYDLLSKGFGVGFNAPLLVVVQGLPDVSANDKAAVADPLLAAINAQFAGLPLAPTVLAKKQAAVAQVSVAVAQYAKFTELKLVASRIAKLPDVKQAGPAFVTSDGTQGVIQVIPNTAPTDTKTINLITLLRSNTTQASAGGNNVSFQVTGSTALQNDINVKLANALPQYLVVVVGLSLILLIVAFRSILVPIKATLGFLLSVSAMLGALVAIYQWGWFGIASAPGPIISFVPIIAIGVLFGLGMDYEFFLVSSMHEVHARTKDAKLAVVTGFSIGSKVVTAAAIIMMSVFAGFITNHDQTIQTIGFGLAFGVFLDAFIVRMSIVPAVMTLLGNSAWWLPKWLNRIIPHVSIEGEETLAKDE
jgi:RND superfamily putative drug exporter